MEQGVKTELTKTPVQEPTLEQISKTKWLLSPPLDMDTEKFLDVLVAESAKLGLFQAK